MGIETKMHFYTNFRPVDGIPASDVKASWIYYNNLAMLKKGILHGKSSNGKRGLTVSEHWVLVIMIIESYTIVINLHWNNYWSK
jgi:hypothetical protein